MHMRRWRAIGRGTRGEARQGKRSHLGKEDKDGREDTPRLEAAGDEVGEGPVGMALGQQQKHGPTWPLASPDIAAFSS